MTMRTNDKYKVAAIAANGTRKTIAKAVGAFRATRLKNEIERRGFRAEVTAVYILKD
jgi:ribosomal protein L21